MTAPRSAALVGNPNAGKSALFNALTGARQKIANYPGVTVERKAGRLVLPGGEVIELTDDGRPAGVQFRFAGRLEDRSWRWVQWEGNRYVPFVPPPVGGHVELPGSKLEF